MPADAQRDTKREMSEEAMSALAAARERLIAARMYMRHDYAWKDTEFREAEHRMTGVACRLLYLFEMWRHSVATKQSKFELEALDDAQPATGLDSSVRAKVLIEANGYEPFQTHVADACAAMGFDVVDSQQQAQAQLVFMYIAPPGEERVDDQYAVFTALTDLHKSQQTDTDQRPLFFTLQGESAFLELPANAETERLRGLSGFAISQHFTPLLQDAKYESLAQFAVEYKPSVVRDAAEHGQLGDLMNQFGCMEHNLMHHTEKWEVFGFSDSALAQDEDLHQPSEDEARFWLTHTQGKACDECYASHARLLRCSRCGNAFYCSRECQKTAWKLHKRLCGKPVEEIN